MSVLFDLIKDMFFEKQPNKENNACLTEIDHDLLLALGHHQAGRLDDAETVYRAILQAEPQNPDVNHKLGELLLQAHQPETALSFLRAAFSNNPDNSQYWQSLTECLVQLQAWNEVIVMLNDADEKGLEVGRLKGEVSARMDQIRHIEGAKNRFPGPDYFEWLKWLHATIRPESYVEIGVETGRSLRFAQRPTKSIGIDPAVNVVVSIESWVKLYKLPSDDFFAQYDLRQVLDTESVDMAFIDGLHTFDQALKDFINIEHYSLPGTVVAFHDIFPVTPITAARDRETIFWLGDTWKVVLILKEMRPDLKIFTIPTFPSGLTLVTGLNANSQLLVQEMETIINHWMGIDLGSYMDEIDTHLNVVNNEVPVVSKLLGY